MFCSVIRYTCYIAISIKTCRGVALHAGSSDASSLLPLCYDSATHVCMVRSFRLPIPPAAIGIDYSERNLASYELNLSHH